MAKDPFRFLRATFYRSSQHWNDGRSREENASPVLSVGDLHVENFGTWRDAEGRLVWGCNDFDEAYPLPWTQDLVRLSTSAHLAISEDHLSVRRGDACDPILAGYARGLEDGGNPFILAEEHSFLRDIALGKPRDPQAFWDDFAGLKDRAREPPPEALALLRKALPSGRKPDRPTHRLAGLGSLGRERIAAIAAWQGGMIAREVKSVAASAAAWALGERSGKLHGQAILASAVRAADPFVEITDAWVLQRLAPDCARIDLKKLPEKRDESRLLWSMGYETANVHLGTHGARKMIRSELQARGSRWLHDATKPMLSALKRDWDEWRAT
jgi:hypothetical protein